MACTWQFHNSITYLTTVISYGIGIQLNVFLLWRLVLCIFCHTRSSKCLPMPTQSTQVASVGSAFLGRSVEGKLVTTCFYDDLIIDARPSQIAAGCSSLHQSVIDVPGGLVFLPITKMTPKFVTGMCKLYKQNLLSSPSMIRAPYSFKSPGNKNMPNVPV